MHSRILFLACLASLLLPACKTPSFPDGEICALIDDAQDPSQRYLYCVLRSNENVTRRIPVGEAFAQGYLSISPDYYVQIEEYRREMNRWIRRNCK